MTEPVTIPLGFAADGARQQPGLEASRLTGLPATSHGAGASEPPTRSGRRHRPSSRAATPVTRRKRQQPRMPQPPCIVAAATITQARRERPTPWPVCIGQTGAVLSSRRGRGPPPSPHAVDLPPVPVLGGQGSDPPSTCSQGSFELPGGSAAAVQGRDREFLRDLG